MIKMHRNSQLHPDVETLLLGANFGFVIFFILEHNELKKLQMQHCAATSNVAGLQLPAGEVYVSDRRTPDPHLAQITVEIGTTASANVRSGRRTPDWFCTTVMWTRGRSCRQCCSPARIVPFVNGRVFGLG